MKAGNFKLEENNYIFKDDRKEEVPTWYTIKHRCIAIQVSKLMVPFLSQIAQVADPALAGPFEYSGGITYYFI